MMRSLSIAVPNSYASKLQFPEQNKATYCSGFKFDDYQIEFSRLCFELEKLKQKIVPD